MKSEPTTFKLPLDHVVISVSNLKKSVEQFKSLGFHVEYGGQNGPTHNALIFFKDGTYIELISLRFRFLKALLKTRLLLAHLSFDNRKTISLNARFSTWFNQKPSMCDWCLRCEDIHKTVAALQTQGQVMTKVENFERMRPDGMVAKWRLSGAESRSLPFLIEDISSPNIRVPYAENSNHDNGVIGISGLTVNQQDLDVTDNQLAFFCNTLADESLLRTNIRVENRPHEPDLLLELKTTGTNTGQITDVIKLNAHISIIK